MAITNATQPFTPTQPAPSGYDGLPSPSSPALADSVPAAGDMIDRVVQGAHHTIDRLAEQAAPKLAQLSDSLSHAGGALHDKTDQLRAAGDEWAESLRGTVRENPLAALAAAVAVGVLVARLTR